MDKQRSQEQIPVPKNAATKAQVEEVRLKAERLGIDFHDAVKEAGISRNTGYTLLRGRGSVGSLRTVEEWLLKAAKNSSRRPNADPLAEWVALGKELHELDRRRFDEMLDGLRVVVDAKKREADGINHMFRGNPDYKK